MNLLIMPTQALGCKTPDLETFFLKFFGNQIKLLITPAQAIGHKTPDLETLFLEFFENQATKNDEFLKEIDNW